MKKTLITLLALASAAVAADYGTVFTTTNSATETNSEYLCKGFIFNLNGSAFSTTSDPSESAIEGMVELTSITLNTGTATGWGSWAKDGKNSLVITDTDFSIIGWSTTVSTASTTGYTWYFVSGADNAPVILDSSKDYLVLADSSTSFTKGTTLIQNNKVLSLGSNGVSDYGEGNLDFSSTSTDKYSGLQFVTVADPGADNPYKSYEFTNSTQYAPNVTFVTKAIPEPTTATLSLLALAGLAMRRRRK